MTVLLIDLQWPMRAFVSMMDAFNCVDKIGGTRREVNGILHVGDADD